MKLHASGEDYLETILVLQKKRGMVRSVDVARQAVTELLAEAKLKKGDVFVVPPAETCAKDFFMSYQTKRRDR